MCPVFSMSFEAFFRLFTLPTVCFLSPLFYLSSEAYLKYIFKIPLGQVTSGIMGWGNSGDPFPEEIIRGEIRKNK